MRICCVFALALVAATSPVYAKSSHKHPHHGRAHHHAHHAAHARVRPTVEPGTVQAFSRTDATDARFFSDPSFPNRAWSGSQASAQTWGPPAQVSLGGPTPRVRTARAPGALDAMIARHAAANGLPAELVHRVVKRESGYNARASARGNFGLMQIRYATARGVGYSGSAAGLLDPETNLTYAVRYLAGAYRAAGGNAGRAVAYYTRGYRGRGAM